MKQDISFHVNITKNNLDKNGIILTAMHKFVARVHVVDCSDLNQLQLSPKKSFILRDTMFFAMTKEQNCKISDAFEKKEKKIESIPLILSYKPLQKKNSVVSTVQETTI